MRRDDDPLTTLVRGAVEPLGYELLGVQHLERGGAAGLLRVYIDHARGIGLDDCEAVSRQLSAVLDVEDPISGQYDLEVSSPGLDRPLFTAAQMARHLGSLARVKLAAKLAGRRRFEGRLLAVDAAAVTLAVDGEPVALPLEQVESARLVPDFGLAGAVGDPRGSEGPGRPGVSDEGVADRSAAAAANDRPLGDGSLATGFRKQR